MKISRAEKDFLVPRLMKYKMMTFKEAVNHIKNDNNYLKELTRQRRAEKRKRKRSFKEEFRKIAR